MAKTPLLIGLLLLAGSVAEADEPALDADGPEPPVQDAPPAIAAPRASGSLFRGPALGIDAGHPTALTAQWSIFRGQLSARIGVGTGTIGGAGLTVAGDVIAVPLLLVRRPGWVLAPEVGLGLRYYRHHYEPSSVDEFADVHVGMRATVGVLVALAGSGLSFHLDASPGYDLSRSESCSLQSGTMSLCPHAQSGRGFFDVALGVRWHFAR
jgi:hypothetical protein